jgi:hypothetical protein
VQDALPRSKERLPALPVSFAAGLGQALCQRFAGQLESCNVRRNVDSSCAP